MSPSLLSHLLPQSALPPTTFTPDYPLTQGISAIENICGRPHVLNHNSVPAACFTHPEVSFVGVTQEKAEEMAKEQGFPLGIVKTSFKANSKVSSGL